MMGHALAFAMALAAMGGGMAVPQPPARDRGPDPQQPKAPKLARPKLPKPPKRLALGRR